MITTDYYDLCENAVVALIRSTAAFGWKDAVKQVTKSNDTHLDAGFDNFAITYPGAFPTAFVGTDVLKVEWEIQIDIIVRWKTTEEAAWTEFRAHRSRMFNLFNLSYEGRNLNRLEGIETVTLASNDRPRYIPLNRDPKSDIVSHIAQVAVLTVPQTINKE